MSVAGRRLSRCVASAFVAWGFSGCTTLGGDVASQSAGPEIREDAAPEYDVLVAQQHEANGRVSEALAAYERALTKDPASAFLHYRVAESLVRKGSPGRALEHARQAYEIDPDDTHTRLFLAQLYRLSRRSNEVEAILVGEDGRPISSQASILLYQVYLERDEPQRAIELANQMIEDNPGSVVGYGRLAKAYEVLGDNEAAEKALRDALELDPGNLRIYSQLARLARARGDLVAQQEIYREALDGHPHHHSTLMALADAQLHENDTEGAIATLLEVEEHYPDDLRAIERLGFLYYEAEEFEKAADRFQSYLNGRPDDGEVEFFLGIVHRRLADDQAAIASFSAIGEDDEHYAEARTQLAVLYERAGEFQRALEEIERAVARKPTRPRELYSATLRAKAGDFDGAVSYLEGLLLETPDDDELLYNLGVVYGEAKRTEQAIRYMERAIENNPQNASALNYVGYTWAERGDRLDQAEAYIVRALGVRPDDGFITDSLGWVYYMRARPLLDTGREKEAREYIERALEALHRAHELTGGDPVVSEHLGDTYMLLDERKRALERYEEALDLVPREGEQPLLLEKLQNLRREFE
jgi:tetratricopeptide (TPR) repeat protein